MMSSLQCPEEKLRTLRNQKCCRVWLVLREVMVLPGTGLATGIPCAYVLSRYVSSQLFGVTPADMWTCVAAIAILETAAAVSGFVPARRASTIDPITALRYA